MRLEIITRNVGEDAMVRSFIQRKVHFALRRVDSHVDHVVVSLHGDRGSSAAGQVSCEINAYIRPSGQIHVFAIGQSVFDSALQAINKIQHAIEHDIDRHRLPSRIRHQQSKRTLDFSMEHDEPT